jgi:hypothetical protein
MLRRTLLIVAIVLALGLVPTRELLAATRIDMVLVTETGFPSTNLRDWYQLLIDLKVDNLQIRSAKGGDKLAIETLGTETDPTYKVTGLLTTGNQLTLPGGKFAMRDRSGIQTWLTRLREEGAERAKGAPRLPFGMTQDQLTKINEDLSRPVEFPTNGLAVKAVLKKIGVRLAQPLMADPAALGSLGEADKVVEDLQGLSSGTVLALVLRPAGLVLVPRLNDRRQPEYFITTKGDSKEIWPAGWPLKKPEREVLPDLFDILKIEIDDIPVSQVLEAIGGRLKTPVVLDHAALARQGIDITKVKVSLPAGQTMYAIALRKTLFQARLKYEIRADEAGKPLVWITTVKQS